MLFRAPQISQDMMQLTWITLCVSLFNSAPVSGIPFTLPTEIIPPGFQRHTAKLVLMQPMGLGYSSDALCQYLFGPWWKIYQAKRLGRFLLADGRNKLDPDLNKDFTRYMDDTSPTALPFVPVEAAYGEAFEPKNAGWHQNLYGCFTGCQDIRTTLEWIMSMTIEHKQHVRAKLGLAFLCQEGLVSVVIHDQPTLREQESDTDIDKAMKSLEIRMPTKTDRESLWGEESGVTKCKCVKPTFVPKETGETEFENIEKKFKKKSTHARRQRTDEERAIHAELARKVIGGTEYHARARGAGDRRMRRKYKRRNVAGTCRADQDFEEEDEEELDIEDFEIDGAGTSACFDFDYPELPSTTRAGDTEVMEEQADGLRIGELLEAALRRCADFSPDNSGMGESSKDLAFSKFIY